MPTYQKGSQEAKEWARKMADARKKKKVEKVANEPKVKIDMMGETELIIPDWFATKTNKGFKLVNPMTKERNLSVRDGRTSIRILRKPVDDAVLFEGVSETIPLSLFPPKDRLIISNHFDKVKQYKDTDPEKIPASSLGDLKERGRPEKLFKNIEINKERKAEAKRAEKEAKKADKEAKKADVIAVAKPKGRPQKYATEEDRLIAIKAQKKKSDDARYLRNKAKKAELSGGSLTAGDLRNLLDASYDGRENASGFEIDKALSSATSKVYRNPETNQVVVGHMGTQGIMDWGNNAVFALGGKTAYKMTSRYKEAEKVQKKAEKKYGKENVSTIGHSQGGLQAELLGGKSKETITFNKATIPFNNSRNKNQTDVRTSGDIVSSLNPFQRRGEDDVIIKGKTYNPLDIHSAKSIRGLDKNQIIGKGRNIISTDNIKMTIGCGIDGNGCCNMCGGNIFTDISKGVSKATKSVSNAVSKEIVKPVSSFVSKKIIKPTDKAFRKGGIMEKIGKKTAGFALRTAVPALAGLAVGTAGTFVGANPVLGTLAGATTSKFTGDATDKLATKWGVGLTAGGAIDGVKKPNLWVQHIKSFASKNNMTYGCALSDPDCKDSYRKMKEGKSTPAKKMSMKEIQANRKVADKQAKAGSADMRKLYKKVFNSQTEDAEEEDYDEISGKLQQMIYQTSNDKMVRALSKLNYKGKLETNPIQKVMRLLQNFKTIAQMKGLITAIENENADAMVGVSNRKKKSGVLL